MSHRQSRIAVLTAVVACGLIAAGVWSYMHWLSAPQLIKGPMVQDVHDRSFTVVWETGPGRETSARLVRPPSADLIFPAHVASTNRRHVAHFTHLQPTSFNKYQIVCGNQVLCEHVVRTAPAPGRTFRAVAFGDSGSGDAFQLSLARRMVAAEPDIVVHTGDLVYEHGRREDYMDRFYRPYADIIARIPFYPSVGNHDYETERGQPIFDEFVLPANGPTPDTPGRHYWFDYGNARFASIDTNLPEEALRTIVAPWLDGVLADAANRWKVVFFHHPPYTNGRYEPTWRVRKALVPVFDANGVNLVLSGHDHLYERSKPLRADAETKGGTVYVTTGGGGADLYPINPRSDPHLVIQYNAKHSFTIIDFGMRELHVRQINIDGETVDDFDIVRGRASTSSRPSREPQTPSASNPATEEAVHD